MPAGAIRRGRWPWECSRHPPYVPASTATHAAPRSPARGHDGDAHSPADADRYAAVLPAAAVEAEVAPEQRCSHTLGITQGARKRCRCIVTHQPELCAQRARCRGARGRAGRRTVTCLLGAPHSETFPQPHHSVWGGWLPGTGLACPSVGAERREAGKAAGSNVLPHGPRTPWLNTKLYSAPKGKKEKEKTFQ